MHTPSQRDRGCDRVCPPSEDRQTWTVHDGKFFAASVLAGSARAPEERSRNDAAAAQEMPRSRSSRKLPEVECLDEQEMHSTLMPREERAADAAWSVHDGQMFASSVLAGLARAPNERQIKHNQIDEWIETWAQRRRADRVRWRTPTAQAQTPRPASGEAPTPTPCAPESLPQLVKRQQARFEDYKRIKMLGVGQFATVYQARDKDGAEVALKLSQRPLMDSGASSQGIPVEVDAMDVSTWRQEVSLLRRLSESGRVTNLGGYKAHGLADVDGGGLRGFIVMELLGDVNLSLRLRRGARVSVARACAWAGQLAAQLAALHELGVVHRDVKESNVIVGGDDEVRLVDFGLALLFAPPLGAKLTAHESATRVGVYGYMAPELFRGQPYGTAVDVFAYGALLARILACAVPLSAAEGVRCALNRAPFQASPCASQCMAHFYEMYSRPVVSKKCPAALVDLVRDCCAADASQRPTMAKVHERIFEEEAKATWRWS